MTSRSQIRCIKHSISSYGYVLLSSLVPCYTDHSAADTGTFMESSVEMRSLMIRHQEELGGDPLNRPRTESPELQRPVERHISSTRLNTANPSTRTVSGAFDLSRAVPIFQPEKKLKPAPGPIQAIRSIILSSCEWSLGLRFTLAEPLSFRVKRAVNLHTCFCV